MSFAATRSAVLLAVEGHLVEVEAHVSDGVVGMNITGLADASVAESRDRVRAAVLNSGCRWPQQRITVGLSPAALPKHGAGLDLAIAVAVLAAGGGVPARPDLQTMWFGELALDGRVRPARGVLTVALTAKQHGCKRLVVAFADRDIARLVDGIEVIGVSWLAEALNLIGCELPVPEIESIEPDLPRAVENSFADFRDVRGQESAKTALEVAAAGGHHCALLGPPGVGKTLLAERLPGILPELDPSAALEVVAIASAVAGASFRQLPCTPPFAAPHHTASYTSIIGGGSAQPVIGMVTLAHRGVLFLDEAPEFAGNVLDALRQPLESGRVLVARRTFTLQLPARFQLVLAANPCPCGMALDPRGSCRCTPAERRRYLGKISGPLLDRVDIRVVVDPPAAADLDFAADPGRDSAAMRDRVCAARSRAEHRLRGTGWLCNADVPGPALRDLFQLPQQTRLALHTLTRTGNRSARSVDRVAKLAWTVADLAARSAPTPEDVELAIWLRDAGGRWPS